MISQGYGIAREATTCSPRMAEGQAKTIKHSAYLTFAAHKKDKEQVTEITVF
jgi:hypothetical protein